MIKLLKSGRRSVTSYFWYAIGEILLVVIGILLALYLNNWNSSRHQSRQFKSLLQQYYNAIIKDNDLLSNGARLTQNQVSVIDYLLNHPDSIELASLPWLLQAVGQNHFYAKSGTEEIRPFLNYNSGVDSQNAIIKQILSYDRKARLFILPEAHVQFRRTLMLAGIPQPELFPQGIGLSYLKRRPPSFYSQSQMVKSKELLETETMKSLLISMKSEKAVLLRAVGTEVENGQSILKSIQAFHPKVMLVYQSIGVIGDALETGWAQSVSMKCTDPLLGIWEAEIRAKRGHIKFRDRNSWEDNWGSNFSGVPKLEGPVIRNGFNILLEEGHYHIRINIREGTYEFIPLK